LLFIIVHQSFELWFKQILYELETARDAMLQGSTYPARHYLRRVHDIERMLLAHIGIIESMWPQDFLKFRGNLAPASGFQSVQFREIELLSGLREPGLMSRLAASPEEQARLERRLGEPTLWDAFCALLDHHGLAMPTGDEGVEARMATLLKIMRDRDAYPELFYTAEGLLTHDELFVLWRQHHILMVERQIGTKTGTGGSAGVAYLRTTLDKRFFPDLWTVRGRL
jgi:tryptophan 2,3-dioxygenase